MSSNDPDVPSTPPPGFDDDDELPDYATLFKPKRLFSKPTPLTIDYDLIYGTEPPSTAQYHLSPPLSIAKDKLYVQKSQTDHNEIWDENIYEISRSTNGKGKDCFTVTGQRQYTLTGTLKRSLAITGHRWSFKNVRGREMLAFANRTWRNDRGQIIAIETLVVDKKRRGSMRSTTSSSTSNPGEEEEIRPVLQMAPSVGRVMTDLVVAAWVAKCWFAKTAE
jgi:hypothetical protein